MGYAQAPKLGRDTLLTQWSASNFTCLQSDSNVYVQNNANLVVLTYVDDLMIFGPQESPYEFLKGLRRQLLVKKKQEEETMVVVRSTSWEESLPGIEKLYTLY